MNLNVFNTQVFLLNASYIGLFITIFAETGLLIGLVLPGESLLLTAGFLSAVGYLNIWWVLVVTFVAAVLADSTGYALGKLYGPVIFVRRNSFFFDASYVTQARDFYERRGGRTLILARFLPFIRTIAPILAGIGRMRYSVFLAYNILGGLLWTTIIGFLGYELGQRIPNAAQHVIALIFSIAIVCAIPVIVSLVRYGLRRKGR